MKKFILLAMIGLIQPVHAVYTQNCTIDYSNKPKYQTCDEYCQQMKEQSDFNCLPNIKLVVSVEKTQKVTVGTYIYVLESDEAAGDARVAARAERFAKGKSTQDDRDYEEMHRELFKVSDVGSRGAGTQAISGGSEEGNYFSWDISATENKFYIADSWTNLVRSYEACRYTCK